MNEIIKRLDATREQLLLLMVDIEELKDEFAEDIAEQEEEYSKIRKKYREVKNDLQELKTIQQKNICFKCRNDLCSKEAKDKASSDQSREI